MAHFSILHQMQPNLRFEDGPGQRGQVLTHRFWLNSAFERDAQNGTFLSSNGATCMARYFAGDSPVARFSQSRKQSRTARVMNKIRIRGVVHLRQLNEGAIDLEHHRDSGLAQRISGR